MSQQQQIAAPAPDELRRAGVPRLIQELQSLSQLVTQHFGALTAEQLNWKPSADEWSIGQCLDHLITADAQYRTTFEQAGQGTMHRTFWHRLPLIPRLLGTMIYSSAHPETTRPVPAPRIFRPSSSPIEPDVYERFQAHQEQLIGYMRACQDSPIDELIISSPVAVWMVYSLGDAFRIVVAHQYLHLMQAERVQQAAGFPAPQPVAP
jgi:hypothetical protein